MSRRNLGRAFVRVVAIWIGSLMFFLASVAYYLMRDWTRVELATFIRELWNRNIHDVVFLEMWMVSIWYSVIAWSVLAGVAGLALLGIWLVKRFLPWRRWLQLEPANSNSVG